MIKLVVHVLVLLCLTSFWLEVALHVETYKTGFFSNNNASAKVLSGGLYY